MERSAVLSIAALVLILSISIPKVFPQDSFTCTQSGDFPDPNDNQRFYRCVYSTGDGNTLTALNLNCPPGTVYESSLKVNYDFIQNSKYVLRHFLLIFHFFTCSE